MSVIMMLEVKIMRNFPLLGEKTSIVKVYRNSRTNKTDNHDTNSHQCRSLYSVVSLLRACHHIYQCRLQVNWLLLFL